ncbi:MAG TPA: hypothetical protein VEJ18_00605 [Planctomycetota bacterium]|nr:hypothetical protein [Planctomycetota bacterium]
MTTRAWVVLLLSGCATPLAYDQEDADAAALYAALKADAPDAPPALERFIFSLEGDRAAASEALEMFSERLSIFTRAARARRCRWPDWDPVGEPAATLPIRDLQLLCARIHVRFAQGRRAEALEDACTLLKAGIDGLRGPSIVSILHGGIALVFGDASLKRTFFGTRMGEG